MRFLALVAAAALASSPVCAEPLASWNDGAARQAIVSFVEGVTKPGRPSFVPPAERIAVFDNDGTLWSEQPLYVQLVFALDRVKALAPKHPEWKEQDPFRAVLAGDLDGVLQTGKKGLLELVMASHAGMTTDEFAAIADAWLQTARHPKYGRPYTACVYVPMLELIRYLEANDFEVWIVSGGGIEFMRPWTERVYGVPPQRVVGSSIATKYELRDGTPAIVREPAIDFIDDGAGKPVGIQRFIGRRPIAAFGNSDGDFEMLEWVTAGSGPRLGMLLHHDDADREVAYDRESHIGRLARGLDEAPKRGWTVISMKDDWRRVFRFD